MTTNEIEKRPFPPTLGDDSAARTTSFQNRPTKRPLPDGWHEATLKDIALVERGITFPSSAKQKEPFDGSIVCLRTTNVQDSVDWDDLLHIPRTYVKKDEKILRQGDILISMANSRELVGKVSFVDRVKIRSSFGGFIAAIRAYPEILPRFLFYQLRTKEIRSFLQRNSSQTVNIANLSLQSLYPTPIYIAPIGEQERIVAEIEKQFTRLDQAVASLRRLQSNLARYKASVLKAACEGRLVPQDPGDSGESLDEPAADLLARILAERRAQWQAANPGKKYKEPVGVEETAVLPALPDGWVWASLDSVSEVVSGYAFKSRDFIHDGVPVIKIANVGYGEFIWKDQEYLSEDYQIQKENYRVFPETPLLALTRPITNETVKTCLYPSEAPVGLLNQRVAMLNVCDGFHKKYLLQFMQSSFFKQQIKENLSETLQPNLSPRDLSKFAVPLPPLAEQERIVAEVERRLSVVMAIEQTITANLSRAERLRQAILHCAFTGQLVPQEEVATHAS